MELLGIERRSVALSIAIKIKDTNPGHREDELSHYTEKREISHRGGSDLEPTQALQFISVVRSISTRIRHIHPIERHKD